MQVLQLKHMERTESDATRRRKILCLFHEDDYSLFETVAKDILEQSDTSLYFFDREVYPDDREKVEDVLQSVCAAVITVSSKFLFEESSARDIVLPLVEKHKLPILPILTERGLEAAFNEKIGNIQCLCPYAEEYDSTTVPYSEKLNNYLAKLLLSDIDDKKLREAFDASVFLSYRKKDRGLAQKLIKTIHDDPALRSVSVWYDEFLTPGEDFNLTLKSEIEESDLFILAVTPFMLEGDNYVKITEYPLATSLGKSILPFMMESTDREKLSNDFPGISAPFDTDNAPSVRGAILGALDSLGIVPIENTAERLYLKGVAYLKGVCVEKNTDIALSMIKEAANSGYPEAILRLANIYKDGDGVPADTAIAAQWQEKLLSILLEKFEHTPSKENSEQYIGALFDMADIHIKGKNYDTAHKFFLNVNEFCLKRAVGDEDTLKRTRERAFLLSGKALMNAGRDWDAWQWCFNNALEISKELLTKNGGLEDRLSVLEAHGFIATAAERNDSVVAVKEQIVFIKRELGEIDGLDILRGSELVFLRYANICALLSHLYIYMLPLNAALSWNLWDMAMDRVNKNQILMTKLRSNYPSKAADMLLLRTLINEGDIHADMKSPDHQSAAFNSYREARLLFDEIFTEDFSELEAYMILSELDIKAARIFRFKEDYDTANKIYDSSLGYLNDIYEKTGIPKIRRTVYECYTDAAESKYEIGETEQARSLLLKAEELIENKAAYDLESDSLDASPLIPYPDRARALSILANLARDEWDYDTAIEYYTEKHTVVATYARIMKRVVDYKALVASYKELISAHKTAGNFDEARKLEQSFERLLNTYPNLRD